MLPSQVSGLVKDVIRSLGTVSFLYDISEAKLHDGTSPRGVDDQYAAVPWQFNSADSMKTDLLIVFP